MREFYLVRNKDFLDDFTSKKSNNISILISFFRLSSMRSSRLDSGFLFYSFFYF